MFAAHHRLSQLIAIVDLNGQQALGYTADVLSLDPLAARWRAFGWDVHEVDGHDARRARPHHRRARHRCRTAARARRPHDVRQGRLVHGAPDQVALPADVGRASTAQALARSSAETLTRCGRPSSRRSSSSPPRDPRVAAADRRPRLHGARAVRRALPGPLLQRRRRRAEHGRRGDRPGRGGLHAVRLLDRRRSRRCARTSSSATGRCCTVCRCGSSASAADSTTARRADAPRARGPRRDARPAADDGDRAGRPRAARDRAAGDRRRAGADLLPPREGRRHARARPRRALRARPRGPGARGRRRRCSSRRAASRRRRSRRPTCSRRAACRPVCSWSRACSLRRSTISSPRSPRCLSR